MEFVRIWGWVARADLKLRDLVEGSGFFGMRRTSEFRLGMHIIFSFMFRCLLQVARVES